MKLRSLVGKRVVSGVLSAVLALNMAAYLPMSVLANESPSVDSLPIVEREGHKYQVFDNSMSWTEAEAYCQSIGGHLLTISSSDEQQFVNETLLVNIME